MYNYFFKNNINEINYTNSIEKKIFIIFKLIYDPEINKNIWDLGFIYKIEYFNKKFIKIYITFSITNCPITKFIINIIRNKISTYIIKKITIKIIWKPKWNLYIMGNKYLLI